MSVLMFCSEIAIFVTNTKEVKDGDGYQRVNSP